MKTTISIIYIVTAAGPHVLPAGSSFAHAKKELARLKQKKIRAYAIKVVYVWNAKRKLYTWDGTVETTNHDYDNDDLATDPLLESAYHYHQPAKTYDGKTLTFKKVKPYKPPPPPRVPREIRRVGYIITKDGSYELPRNSDLRAGSRELNRLKARGVLALFVLAVYEWSPKHHKFRFNGAVTQSNAAQQNFSHRKLPKQYEPAEWYDGENFQFKASRISRARTTSEKKQTVAKTLSKLAQKKPVTPCNPDFHTGLTLVATRAILEATEANERTRSEVRACLDRFLSCDWGDVTALAQRQNNQRTHTLKLPIRGLYTTRALGKIVVLYRPKAKNIGIYLPSDLR